MSSATTGVLTNLEAARKMLEASSGDWSHLLTWATVAVAIGVIIELLSAVLEAREEWAAHHKLKTKHLLTFVGAAVVLVAVAVEGWAEYKGEVVETKLRANAAATEDQLRDTALNATKDAVDLAAKFGGLHSYVVTEEERVGSQVAEFSRYADSEVGRTNALIKKLRADQGDLERARTEAVGAEKAAQAALTAFRKEAGSRTLTGEQRMKLITALRGRISVQISVESVPGDVEAYPYAMQFLDALRASGLKAEWHPFPAPFFWFNEPGIYVWESGKSSKESGDLLLQALRSAGIDAQEAELPKDQTEQGPPSIALVIWHQKPLAPINH